MGASDGTDPTDRAKLGSKRHLICDGRAVPLAVQLTGANCNDSQQALALVDAIPTLQGVRRPAGRKRVQMLAAYGVRRDGTRHLLAFLRSQGRAKRIGEVCSGISTGAGWKASSSG